MRLAERFCRILYKQLNPSQTPLNPVKWNFSVVPLGVKLHNCLSHSHLLIMTPLPLALGLAHAVS